MSSRIIHVGFVLRDFGPIDHAFLSTFPAGMDIGQALEKATAKKAPSVVQMDDVTVHMAR